MCFSATLPDAISNFAKTGLRNPVVVKLDQEHKIPDTLELKFFYVRNEDKEAVLMHLLFSIIGIEQKSPLVLVFVATKHHVEYLEFLLQHTKIPVAGLYGD
mmetsp:Transcript_8890/g.1278  ORF Transcript_8890/g.1278 Transcript_8890/m.1278 type:complete len:101 (+) Transcript_8890:541-843(+)